MKVAFHLIILVIVIFVFIVLASFNVITRDRRLKLDLSYNDDSFLKDVNILGTHNSMTYTINNYFSFHGKTQRLTLRDQYEMGVRFFDIRLAKKDGRQIAHHGIINLGLDFEEIKNMFKDILKRDKKGFIILSIKREDELDDEDAALDLTDDIFLFNDNDHLTIGKIRGRILIINHFAHNRSFAWPYNRTFKSRNLWIQDKNEGTVKEKVQHIKEFVEAERDEKDLIRINFLTIQTNIYMSVSILTKLLQKRIFDQHLLKGKNGFIFVFDYADLLSLNSLLEEINLPIL